MISKQPNLIYEIFISTYLGLFFFCMKHSDLLPWFRLKFGKYFGCNVSSLFVLRSVLAKKVLGIKNVSIMGCVTKKFF